MIHDNLPKGVQKHINSSLADLEAAAGPVNDVLDTLMHLAKPLTVGLESEYRSLDTLIQRIKDRWAFYQANGAWPSSGDQIGMTRATARSIESTSSPES